MTETAPNAAPDPARPTHLAREEGRFVIPAEMIAARFGLEAGAVPALMRSGAITSRTEQGIDADAGRWRLTLFHGGQALRLTVDEAGLILSQSRYATGGAPASSR